MARRRDTGTVSFDVSAGADDSIADAASIAAERPAGPSLRERWRTASRRRRRAVAGAAGGIVLVVAGAAVLSGPVMAHAEAERLRSAPGGVLSLDGELAETWGADVDGLGPVLPGGGLVVLQDDAAVALDVATGEERWRVDLGADPECGPQPTISSGVDWTIGVELVTCLHGTEDERTVTVLGDAGGVVGQRSLEPGTYAGAGRRLAPAADGGLVVVEHETGLPEEFVGGGDIFTELDRLEPSASTATVEVEDALTGERRFEVPVREVPADRAAVSSCYGVQVAEDDTVRARLVGVDPTATPTMVGYQGCGVEAAATADGRDLLTGSREASGAGYPRLWSPDRQPYPGGGFVVTGPDQGSTLLADDGTTVLESSDRLLAPRATDGTADGLVLAVRGDDVVVATDRAGTELWRRPVGGVDLAVSTAGAVVTSAWRTIVGLDPLDGTELWTVRPDAGTDWYPVSAVTDGDRVATVVEEYTDTGEHLASTLLTVDLATGGSRRTPLDDDGDDWPVAVDGQLLLLDLEPDGGALDVVGVRALAVP
ncbi:hypothetical protein [Isoptericola aurantiacus]|uniref:hypothetical protein n=1 Tax=Isoptericola aurantiacus TaxID=3377839 RepID=UPI00383BD892